MFLNMLSKCVYIYIYSYVCVYIYIYIYVNTQTMPSNAFGFRGPESQEAGGATRLRAIHNESSNMRANRLGQNMPNSIAIRLRAKYA